MTLKWVPAGSSREISYAIDGFEYVIRTDHHPKGVEYVLIQRTRWGEILHTKGCGTKDEALALAEKWADQAASLTKTAPPAR
jgi:hypothetical protein